MREKEATRGQICHWLHANTQKMMFPIVRLLLPIVSALSIAEVDGSESRSLTVHQPNAVSNFQTQDPETVGLLEASKNGRAEVVRLPCNNADSGKPPTLQKRKRGVTHIKASLLSVGLLATLVRNLVFVDTPTRNDWAAFVFLLILYLVEAATCSTRRYLDNIKTPLEVRDYIGQLQEVAPRVRFHLECYHYEDDDGFRSFNHRRHTASGNNRRVTHRASEVFDFQR